MYFDLNCDAECNGVNVGCLGVSLIDVLFECLTCCIILAGLCVEIKLKISKKCVNSSFC